MPDFQRDLSDLKGVISDLNKDRKDSPFTPVYLSAIPLDEEKARDYWTDDIFNNDRFVQYDEAVRSHAEETGADYIDLREGFDSETMLAEDAVHPNEVGSRFVYGKISTVVFKHLDIASPTP